MYEFRKIVSEYQKSTQKSQKCVKTGCQKPQKREKVR